jgi:drug/metabolite transporter (DMT)-like permease
MPHVRHFIPGYDLPGRPAGKHEVMSFLSRWWYRPVPRRRAILVLVLMLIATVLFVWQAVGDVLQTRSGVVIAWVCAALLAVDSVRVAAGLAADRYPRD